MTPANIKTYLLYRLSAITIVVTLLVLYIVTVYNGEACYYRLYYFIPASIAAVLFVFDRIDRFETFDTVLIGADIFIAVVSLIRVRFPIWFYSGHALFFTYALFTVRDRLCLMTSAIVLAQTVYLKIFVWDNNWSVYGGILMGCMAGILYRLYKHLHRDTQRTHGDTHTRRE